MPRPGPRPYECVRRAWHSDRHLPIRGSLIQEIFRLVNEVHKTETKKNKEWQEKLPIVVLRAEEIMYSKANSEAEYVDLKTLSDRVDDAINTIIRRDETSDNGKLLQPCTEAALHLGCTPRRSSRSQRNHSPGYYLTPVSREDPSLPPGYIDNISHADQTPYSPFMTQQSKLVTATNKNCSARHCPPSNSYSVYPLYYADKIHVESSNLNLKQHTYSDSRLVEAETIGVRQNLSSSELGASVNFQSLLVHPSEKKFVCDLSLRLGPLETSCVTDENRQSKEVANGGFCLSQKGRKITSPLQQMENGFSVFSTADANKQLDSSSMRKGRDSRMNFNPMLKKRKAITTEGQSCSRLKPPSKGCDRMTNAGL